MELHQSLEIKPNRGIGPFLVGMTEIDLFELIPKNTPKRKFSTRYTVEVGAVTLWVDRNSKKVTQIGVSTGFKGMLFGAVGIGCSVEEAEKYLGVFVVNEDFHLAVPGLSGICFHTNPVVNDLAPVPIRGALIDGIYVYTEQSA